MAKKKARTISTKTTSSKSYPRKWKEIEDQPSTSALNRIAPEISENEYSRKYPSPSNNSTFHSRWNEFIQNVAIRDNFNRGHLEQLSLLCDLYVEYEVLSKYIALNGYSYESYGQSGLQMKPYPEVGMRARVLAEIRNYSKILGLVLVKDNSSREAGDESDNWT